MTGTTGTSKPRATTALTELPQALDDLKALRGRVDALCGVVEELVRIVEINSASERRHQLVRLPLDPIYGDRPPAGE